MADAITKFIRKLTPKQQARVKTALKKLASNDIKGLDIKPLTGQKNWYRCRIGKIRILFIKTGTGTNIIYQITYRDKAYK